MERPDGYQINANPIEETLLKLDGVKRCCVVGLKYKDENGVIPTAFVELENKFLKLQIHQDCINASRKKTSNLDHPGGSLLELLVPVIKNLL